LLGHLAPNRYELDLSNDLLYALVGQGAAKISEIKVEGRKKMPTRPNSILPPRGPADNADFFFDLQL